MQRRIVNFLLQNFFEQHNLKWAASKSSLFRRKEVLKVGVGLPVFLLNRPVHVYPIINYQ